MDWHDLTFILAVARKGTLAAAATDLGVNHTTVGRRLRTAEAQLGVRLFDRTPDGLLPTAAGQGLVEVAERVESEILSAEARIMGQDADLRGGLRVTTLDYLFWGMHSAFSTFIERYPAVDLTITASTDTVSLTRREADVALRLTGSPPENLIGRKLCDVYFAPYASDALIERIGASAGLGEFPWIGFDERLDSRWLSSWLAKHAPGAQLSLRLDEGAILRRQAVCAGMGVGFMPCFEADALDGLTRMMAPVLSRPLWLLTLPELRHTSRVRAFMDHIGDVPNLLGQHRT